MVKSRIWRANSKVTPLDSVVSAHPQNISLSLPTDLKKLRSIGPFYLAIIELNPKQRMGVNKSDSYIRCRRKNVKRPFGTKNVCEEADRFRILVQFFSSLSIQENHTAAPAYQTVVQHFHGCQVTINYGAALVFFNRAAIKHCRSLPVPYLNLWLRFPTVETAN